MNQTESVVVYHSQTERDIDQWYHDGGYFYAGCGAAIFLVIVVIVSFFKTKRGNRW